MNSVPFMTALDQLAASTLHTLAIKREPSRSPRAPNWYDNVPKSLHYPFYEIKVPRYSGNEEAKLVAEKIKLAGNELFKAGNFYEAIWKYEHALIICRQVSALRHTAALLHSNIAAACLKLGNERRVDLLDNHKFPPSVIMWYVFGQQHAGECVSMKPPVNILSKAHYRRGECFRVILKMPDLQQTIETMASTLPNAPASATRESFVQVIEDFVKCLELQSSPDPKIFVEVIFLCVDYDHQRFIPAIREHNTELPTNILMEMIQRYETELKHLHYLLLTMSIRTRAEPQFDASSINVLDLIYRKLVDTSVLKKLFQCGMTIKKNQFDLVRKLHQTKNLGKSIYEVLASHVEESPEEVFVKLKTEGNALFGKGLYEQSLGIYYKALHHCRKHKLSEEMAVVRANCAQACLNLQLYSDAYSHADQCVKIDPQSYKGYFRRADALKGMLRSPGKSSPGTYAHVVKDYLKSHQLKTNIDAFCNAVLVTIDEEVDRSVIPFMTRAEITSGLSNTVLQKIFTMDVSDKHLTYVIFDWPHGLVDPYDCKHIKIQQVCKKSRNAFVYKKLFDLRMRASEEDLLDVVELLPGRCGDCMEIIANNVCVNLENRAKHILINKSCSRAMELGKPELAIALLKNGALPSKKEVKACKGMRGNPVVEAYLKGEGLVGPDVSSLSPHQAILTLNKTGEEWGEEGKFPQATQLFRRAVRIAQDNDLVKDEVMSRYNLACLFRKQELHYDAYMETCESLKLDKNDGPTLLCRGHVLKLCLDRSEKPRPVDNDMAIKYGSAVKDISRGNLLSPNPERFAEAILMAVLYNQYHELHLFVDTVGDAFSFRSSCLVELLYLRECNSQVAHFVMCKFWANDKMDASPISLLHVLGIVGVREMDTIQRFMDCNMEVHERDMACAIKLLNDKDPQQLEIFKLVASRCPVSELDSLCSRAVRENKVPFVFSLIECGGQCPGDSVKILHSALKANDNVLVMNIIQNLKPEVVRAIDLGELLHSLQITSPQLIKTLIRYGVSPSGRGSKLPLVVVLSMEHLSAEKRCVIACLLLEGGADCNQLCKLRKGTTTPLHVAAEYCLLADGETALIKAVLASKSFNSKKLTNDKQETPLHIATKPHRRREPSTAVLKALLESGLIDPNRRDKSSKRAIDLLSKSDARYKMLENAMKSFKTTGPSSKKKSKKKPKQPGAVKPEPQAASEAETMIEESPTEAISPESTPEVAPKQHRPEPKKEFDYNSLSSVPERFNWLLEQLLMKSQEYFTSEELAHSDHEVSEETPHTENQPGLDSHQLEPVVREPGPVVREPGSSPVKVKRTLAVTEEIRADTDMNSLVSDLGFELDRLPWEVEGTDKVIKFFKDTKRNSQTDRVSAARAIHRLAEGKRNQHLAKPVSTRSGLLLYEARITQAGRLLWEKAITFSPKLTAAGSKPVYTQVIRVWEVVLDHDALDRRIKYCAEQIERSYDRGRRSAVRWSLKSRDHTPSGVHKSEKPEWPRIFLPDSQCQEGQYQFIPAASTKQNEYNITTFFSFDTISIKSILMGTNQKRDYPFKEWHKEHEIISLCTKAAILLLGRSGTGKTTCCLYKLWNEFKAFWNPLSKTYNFKRPRRVLVTPMIQSYDHFEGDSESLESPTDTVSSGDQCEDQVAEEDLQQVFITKNYVLCDQIKKRFYSMVAAHDFLDSHLEFENKPLPNSFSEIKTLAYPLFLTARQFYTLLDNSLGDDQSFFRRDSEGNVNVKIASADYEHEDIDILLDFDDSGSETESDAPATGPELVAAKQQADKWTEVTALYFKEVIWPTISHQCHVSERDYDPMLVWIEIQSFIKGSERALRKGEHLNAEEYYELGFKMAPHFASVRKVIFQLFLKYQLYLQRVRHREFLFDECDLMLNLFKRRQLVKEVQWSFHSIYIDEVQDFTQAELTVLIHCCRDPNSMFFTGDTAQSIMRGVAFRFQDLRSLYHSINQQASFVHIPNKPHTLAINFRSHSGVLKLAGSVIDLISEFFKDSIDVLPDDVGMFPGPIPVLVESCQIDELALLLSANRRKSSAIEFGAHQAIIVQSKQSKDKLPDILKGAIVLTVFEAKGLEFDDVLLYNFFTDSAVDEKGWRVITSYLEMARHQEKVVNYSKLPGSSCEPRSKPFDPQLHKSLNSELKYLYTAITRTKCNLWIYDSSENMRLPMFSYWHKREVVKVIQSGAHSTEGESEKFLDIVFAANSTTRQWKTQGDNFRKKHLWEQAKLCYERSGPEYQYLVKEAHAYQLIHSARQQRPALYLEAAVLFLESNRLRHRSQCIQAAALCLRHARPPKLTQAGRLYEKLAEYSKACQAYLRAKDFDNFSRLKEMVGGYESVVRTLLGKPFMRKRDALMKAREYEQLGIQLPGELSASKLAYSCAKFYSERKDHQTLIDVLQYMPEVDRKIGFLKEAKLYKRAFAECEENKIYHTAYRLASAQGFYTLGIALACKQKDRGQENMFILQSARCKFCRLLEAKAKSKEPLATSKALEIITEPVMADLGEVVNRGRPHNTAVSNQAALLLGVIKQDSGLCKQAWQGFRKLQHKIGTLEAFNCLQELTEQPLQVVLEMCQFGKELARTFDKAKDINNDVQQGRWFYDIKKIGQLYLIPPNQDIWIRGLVRDCSIESDSRDTDGMHRLDAKKVCQAINKHIISYTRNWSARSKIEGKLVTARHSFSLHKDIGRRPLDRVYEPEEVSSEALRQYILHSLQFLHIRLIEDKEVEETIPHIVAIFSPQITRYLPFRYTEQQTDMIRKYPQTHPGFVRWVDKALAPSKEFPDKVYLDSWLNVWRGCSLIANTKPLTSFLDELNSTVTKKSENKDYAIPSGYLYRERRYFHVFSMWLSSCSEFREGKILASSRRVIHQFIAEVAMNQALKLSPINTVDILTLHSTALLVILRHIQDRQKPNAMSELTVPLMYKSTVQLFDQMLSDKDTKFRTLTACADEVASISSSQDLSKTFKEARLFLFRMLDILVGVYKKAPKYSVIGFTMRKMPEEDITRHCAILTFTVFGNLMLLGYKEVILKHRDKLFDTLSRILHTEPVVPHYLEYIVNFIAGPLFLTPRGVFGLVDHLLKFKKEKQSLARITLKANGKIEFSSLERQPPPPANITPGDQNPTSQPAAQSKAKPSSSGAARLPFTATRVSDKPAPSPVVDTEPAIQQEITQPLPSQPAFSQPVPQQPVGTTSHVQQSIGSETEHPQLTHVAQQPQQLSLGIRPQQPIGMGTQQLGMGPQQRFGMGQQHFGTQLPYRPFMTGLQQPRLADYPYPGFLPSAQQAHQARSEADWQELFMYPSMQAVPGYTSQHHPEPSAWGYSPAQAAQSPSEPTDVGVHVVASYSNEQLRQIASQSQGDQCNSSELLTEEDLAELDEELAELDEDLAELDEELGFDPAPSTTSAPVVPAVDPELVDPSIVTVEGCDACGLSFPSEDDNSLYNHHITTEAHQSNAILFKKFYSLLDSDDNQRCYFKMTVKVRDLAERCRKVKDTERIDRLVDEIKGTVERNDKNLEQIQQSHQWRRGIEEIQRMIELMDSQLYNGELLYSSALAEEQQYREYITNEDLEMELEMLSQQSLGDEPVVEKQLRSAAEKQESRQRKRIRREQGRGGNRK